MSEPIGSAVSCQQCEDITFVLPAAREEQRAQLEAKRWRPYGEGITPLAEENAQAGRFACARCAGEFMEQRLNRIASDVMSGFDAGLAWNVARSQNSDMDSLHIRRGDERLRIPLNHTQTDREMRENLRQLVGVALGVKA